MRILLLNPTIRSGEPVVRAERCQSKVISGIWPPIALAYLGAILRGSTRTLRLFDAVIGGESFANMVRVAADFKPDWIIVQNTTPTLPDDLSMARALKQLLPDVHITFFGLHATARPHDVLAEGTVDTAVMGEPELTVLELAECLEAGCGAAGVLGTAYSEAGETVVNPPRPLIPDVDALPFPDLSLLDNQRYVVPISRRPFTLVKTSRGCPFACSFCTSPLFYGTTWRCRQPAAIHEEIMRTRRDFDIHDFALHSETFNGSEKFVMELCDLLARGPDTRWMCNSRADCLTEETARAMRAAGCWLVTLGVESGSDEILTAAGKKATVADARRAIALLKRQGLKVIAYFLLGLPGETEETARATLRLALESAPDYAHFYVATPFPGTELFAAAEREGWLRSRDWTRYYHGVSDVLSYPHLSAERLTELSRSFYRKFYFRPRRIAHELLEIRSFSEAVGRASALRDLIRVWMLRS